MPVSMLPSDLLPLIRPFQGERGQKGTNRKGLLADPAFNIIPPLWS